MTSAPTRPVFSVIIPTRNRAALFEVALQSVLDQRFEDFEVIVVNDGSSEAHATQYRELLGRVRTNVRVLELVRTDRGHGQSYALNFGAAHANGDYLCFLDDDDQWTDPDHLQRVANVITGRTDQIDLILSNQKAFRNGIPVDQVVWIEDLTDRLASPPDAAGAYTVDMPELLRCQAHCHLNTMVTARNFYLRIGGLDEGLRYECDRDFYLRAIDQARLIKYLPNTVSRHNIPDPTAQSSMSTAESELSKRLYQLRVFDKTVLFSTRIEMQRYAMEQRAYTLGHIGNAAQAAGRLDPAKAYSQEALLLRAMLRWKHMKARLLGKSPSSEAPA